MSEEKFSKCEEGKKIVSVEFRVFGKNENWKKSSGGEKKSKCFEWKLKLKLWMFEKI